MDSLGKNLALYSSTYENYIVLGDFNAEVDNNAISSFCDAFDLPEKPSCIDLILTNKPHSFQISGATETGLSDFHRMTVTVTKMTFQKLKPRIINYKDYKFFVNVRYRNDLQQEISNSYLEFNDNGFSGFFYICRTTLDQHAPRKKKYARGNHMPFINKTLSEEIMKRTKLRNKFLKDNRNRYASQRNYCVSLLKKKLKKNNLVILMKKNICDNKTFWKTVSLRQNCF